MLNMLRNCQGDITRSRGRWGRTGDGPIGLGVKTPRSFIPLFLVAQGMHLLVLIAFIDQMPAKVLLWSGVSILLVYGATIFQELRRQTLLISPFVIYLMIGVFAVGIVPIWAAAASLTGHEGILRHGAISVINSLAQGQLLLVATDWCLVAGYWLGSLLWPMRAEPSPPRNVMLWTAVICGATATALKCLALLGIDASKATGIIKTLIHYGPAAFLLIVLFCLRQSFSGRLIVLAAVYVAFELIISLRSYMKANTLYLMIPLVVFTLSHLVYQRGRKVAINVKLVACLIFLAYGITFFLFPFNQIRRAVSWEGQVRRENVEVTPHLIRALKGAVPGTAEFDEIHTFPNYGFWSFVNRVAYLKGASWSFEYVQRHGSTDSRFLIDGLLSLIPRSLWDDKPAYSPGRKIAVMLRQAQFEETATTASDAGGLAGGLYLSGGWPYVILGAMLNGLFLQIAWRVLFPTLLNNPFGAIAAISLYVLAGKYFSAVDGNIVFFANFLAFLLIFVLPWALIQGRRKPWARNPSVDGPPINVPDQALRSES